MLQFFLYALIITLKNTAIHVLFWEGMLLGNIRIAGAKKADKLFGLTASKYIQKPLWDCLPCMASLWSCVWLMIDGFTNPGHYLTVILVVCGMSVIIDSLLPNVCSNPEKLD